MKSLFLLAFLFAADASSFSVPCKITEVYDGDTVTCEITVRFRVRLIDCWAPELRDPGGKESREHLAEACEGKRGILSVPLGKRLDHSISLSRLLGRISVDGKDLSDAQVEAGHATSKKIKNMGQGEENGHGTSNPR